MRSPRVPVLPRLTRRGDFQRMTRRARKAVTPSLILQAMAAGDGPPHVGFTASRKVGNAVARNRARRRLRAAVHDVLARRAQAGWHYVLIARQGTLTRDYDALLQDLTGALGRVADTPRDREASP